MGKSGLLLLVVAFAAGGGIGFVAGTGGGDSFEIGDGPGLDAPRSPTPGPSREMRPLPDDVRRSITGWIDGFPAPKVASGNGVITGTVRAEDGTPLAGALVRATPRQIWRGGKIRGGGPPEDPELETVVRERVERVLKDRAARVEVMTDADGTYRLTGLVDSSHTIMAWLEGYQIQPRGNAYQAKSGETVDFIGKPVVRVPLTVLGPEGGQPEGNVQIVCVQGNRSDAQHWNAEIGAIALAPGVWKIRAASQENMHSYMGQGGRCRSDEVQLVLEAGVTPEPVSLQLVDRPGIMGSVVFPPGDVNAYCQVSALKVTAGKDPDPDRLATAGQQTYVHGQTGGAFFLELPAGTWLVGLVTNQRKVVTSKIVEVTSGVTEVTLEFPEPDPEDSVVVRVEGPDGKLVGEASFTGGYQSPTYRSGGGTVRSVRQADGTFLVHHHEMDRDRENADGRYWFQVQTSRYGMQRAEYVRDSTRDLTIRFEHPATLEVTVQGYATSDLAGSLQISVSPKETGNSRRSPMQYYGGRFPGQSGLSAEGVQNFGPLAPGSYVVSVNLKRQQWAFTPIASHDVVLKSGPNTHSVPLPALYSLTVTVEGAGDGTTLRISPTNRGGSRMYFPTPSQKVKNGRVEFDNLPAGEYHISASGGKVKGRMTVTLPGSTTVRFVAEVPRPAYRVRITNAEGLFARAGLKSGDIVIGMNGQEFTDAKQMAALMTAARKQKSAALTVLRGSSRVIVEVDLSATGSGNAAAGGSLYPTTR